MAVGDDDQSIYAFREANVRFIRQFEKDYEAKIHYLTWNYRSTNNIIQVANQLIEHNHDRMKGEHSIEIDESRRMYQSGGNWEIIEPCHGRVVIQACHNVAQQAGEVLRHIRLIQEKDPNCPLKKIAILARQGIEKEELIWVRSVLHDAEIPYCYNLDRDSSFPIHRCREIVQYRAWVQSCGFTPMTPKELASPLPPFELANRWQQLLHELITQWKDNQGDISLPASHFEFFLAEYFNEQRRQIRFGNGILLSTVHGVKGEEFEHVIILDGAWQSAIEKNSAALEEERRVFYVAMTRAISRLVIMQRQDQTHPHIPLLSDFLHYETPKAPTPEKLRRFGCLGMRQLDISYAGAHPANHPIHNKLNSIQTNVHVRLEHDTKKNIKIVHDNDQIAQLSRSGQREWESKLLRIKNANIMAIIQRSKDQEQEEYKGRAQVDNWELPIIHFEYEE